MHFFQKLLIRKEPPASPPAKKRTKKTSLAKRAARSIEESGQRDIRFLNPQGLALEGVTRIQPASPPTKPIVVNEQAPVAQQARPASAPMAKTAPRVKPAQEIAARETARRTEKSLAAFDDKDARLEAFRLWARSKKLSIAKSRTPGAQFAQPITEETWLSYDAGASHQRKQTKALVGELSMLIEKPLSLTDDQNAQAIISNLVVATRRLAFDLNKHSEGNGLSASAFEYLKRHQLIA